MTEPTSELPRACVETTQEGAPCRASPMANADRCVHHGHGRTPAQVDAVRRNAVRHGVFATFLGAQDLGQLAVARECLEDVDEVQRELAAFALYRLGRMAAWEAKPEHEPSALTAVAFERAQRAVAALPRAEEAKGFDVLELDRIVDAVSRRPEVFIKRLPPEVQEKVRAVLQEAGVDPGAA